MSRGVLSLRFNQDHGCFTCATETGLKIYNVEPLTQKLTLGQDVVGSIASAEMLFRSNLVAMVGGGTSPKYDEKAALIWDDTAKKVVMDVSFNQPVVSIKLKYDRLIVVLRNQIHVFSFPNNPTLLHSFDTRDNPKGCVMSVLLDK